MTRRMLLVMALTFIALGCGDRPPAYNVTDVAPDDPQMNAAIEKAKSSIGTFIAALKSPQPSQSEFAIKKAFVDGEEVEFMWLTDVTYDGTQFHGVLNNDPVGVKNVQIGQSFTIAPDDVADWMFIDSGKLMGGYTLRVLRETLTPSQREEFDERMPFFIE